jgi:integrase
VPTQAARGRSRSATTRRRRAVCSTCQAELVKGACPQHGPRAKDGRSLDGAAAARANRGKRFPADPLTQDEVRQLLAVCTFSPTGRRSAALVTLLYRSGLRVSEALALYPRDVAIEGRTVRVLHGKGDKARTVGIDGATAAAITMWLDARRRLGITHHRPLFCTIKGVGGAALTPSYVRHLLPRLAKQAGVGKRVHAHGLRHTHAYELAMESTPLPIIQHQLGHANAAVTSRYIDHIAPLDVAAAIHARPDWDH